MFKICIDSGHGINTSGKRTPDGSMREFEFNNAVGKEVKILLDGYQDVLVIFSHDPSGKVDVPLKERTDLANAKKVDVFVSIHANASGSNWSDARGIETFVYKTNPKESRKLAEKVQARLIADTGLKDRGVKTADFHVLRETKMDAILIECGFMSNKEEAKLLKSSMYRSKVAHSIVRALASHYNLKAKEPQETPVNKPSSDNKVYTVQVGAFKDKKYAEKMIEDLHKKGFLGFIKEK